MTPKNADKLPGKQHIVVVGAGFVGLSTALYLLRDGHQVTLVDREGAGKGASFGNASVFAVDAVAPVAMPGLLHNIPKMILDPLSPLAVRWSYLPKLSPWLLRFVAASRPARAEAIARALAAMDAAGSYHDLQRRHGCRMELLGPDDLRQMEPSLSRDLAGGVLYPDTSHCLEPYGFCRLLARAAQRQGAQLVIAEAQGVRRAENLVTALVTNQGEIACDGLVVAAGAWSGPLSKALGAPTPLDTERGYHLTIKQPGVSLSRPVYSTQYGFAMTPLGEDFRIAGTVELGGLKAPPNWHRADQLLTRARLFLPDLQDGDKERWMGFRPSMPDSLPVISASPEVRNAWLGYGHGHLGLTLGARTGSILSDLVAGRDSGFDLAPYRADRFF